MCQKRKTGAIREAFWHQNERSVSLTLAKCHDLDEGQMDENALPKYQMNKKVCCCIQTPVLLKHHINFQAFDDTSSCM